MWRGVSQQESRHRPLEKGLVVNLFVFQFIIIRVDWRLFHFNEVEVKIETHFDRRSELVVVIVRSEVCSQLLNISER